MGQGGCYCQPISYRCFVSLTGKGKVEKGKTESGNQQEAQNENR